MENTPAPDRIARREPLPKLRVPDHLFQVPLGRLDRRLLHRAPDHEPGPATVGHAPRSLEKGVGVLAAPVVGALLGGKDVGVDLIHRPELVGDPG